MRNLYSVENRRRHFRFARTRFFLLQNFEMVFLQRIENMFKSPFPSPLPISKNDCELEKKSNLNIVGYFVNKQKSKRRHRQKYGKFVIKHNF